MSSRRNLKKLINNSMDLLYTDCIFYTAFNKNANAEKAGALIEQIAEVHNELISRLSISEGKEIKARTKSYYQKLHSDLKTQIDKFGKEIQALD